MTDGRDEKFETVDWEEIKDDVESIFMNKETFRKILKESDFYPDEVVDDALSAINDDVIVRIKLKDGVKFEIGKEFAHFQDIVTPNDKNRPETVSETDNIGKDLPRYGRCETCGSRVLITESGRTHVGEDHPDRFPDVVSEEEPPAVAWEYYIGSSVKVQKVKPCISTLNPVNLPDNKKDEANELIRRSDAEEYYGKREGNRTQWEYGYDCGQEEERQRINEMLEERIKELRKNMDKIDKEGDPSGVGRRLQFPNRYDELMLFKSKLKEGDEE